MKLLGKVSDAEVARRGRVSLSAVARERRRRGIPTANPHREAVKWTASMIRKLGIDSDARVAAELRVPTSAVNRKRRLLGIPSCHPPPREPEAADSWTGKEMALLGTASDARVAKRIRRSLNSVSFQRTLLGIPAFRPNRNRFDWTAKRVDRLGKAPDREIAEELGILPTTVKNKRLELRIPAFYEARRVVVTPELKRLLRQPSTIVRKETGLKFDTIQKLRRELGIEAPTMAELPWTKNAIAKLGTMPDKELAAELGVALTTVFLRRRELGIPAFRKWKRWSAQELGLLRSGLSPAAISKRLRRSLQSVRAQIFILRRREG